MSSSVETRLEGVWSVLKGKDTLGPLPRGRRLSLSDTRETPSTGLRHPSSTTGYAVVLIKKILIKSADGQYFVGAQIAVSL